MSALALSVGLAAGALLTGIMALRRRLVVVPVTGTSMTPGIGPGDRVVVWRGKRARAGTVALVRGSADQPFIVKRVAALPGDLVPAAVRAAVHGAWVVPPGQMVVLADNPDGSDSRHWGFSQVEQVRGRVIYTICRDNRARTLSASGCFRSSSMVRACCQSPVAAPGPAAASRASPR
jgi:signal peptidase I